MISPAIAVVFSQHMGKQVSWCYLRIIGVLKPCCIYGDYDVKPSFYNYVFLAQYPPVHFGAFPRTSRTGSLPATSAAAVYSLPDWEPTGKALGSVPKCSVPGFSLCPSTRVCQGAWPIPLWLPSLKYHKHPMLLHNFTSLPF